MNQDFWDAQLEWAGSTVSIMAEFRANAENERGAEQFEHLRRSLGQKFRHAREDEIAELRKRQNRKRFSLSDPYTTMLWARKLFLQTMRPTVFERFLDDRSKPGSGPQGRPEHEGVHGIRIRAS